MSDDLNRLSDVGISNPSLRGQLEAFLVADTPKEFWRAPASFSGKYHAGETLVEHTLLVARISMHLSRLHALNPLQKDTLLLAAVCHDTFKGMPDWQTTTPDHPALAAHKMRSFLDLLMGGHEGAWLEVWELAAVAVENHMSWWGVTPFRTFETAGLYAHLLIEADYLASQSDVVHGIEELRHK